MIRCNLFGCLLIITLPLYLNARFGTKIYNNSDIIFEQCQAYLTDYATRAHEFITCAILESRPFRVCEVCAAVYTKAISVYKDLKSDDGEKSGCENLLLQSDMVHVLTSTHDFIIDMWKRASCQNCYAQIKENHTTGIVSFELTNMTKKFFSLYSDTLKCFNDPIFTNWSVISKHVPRNKSICTRCASNYTALSDYFNTIDDECQCDVCMDLMDIMNYTRLKWSEDFGCSQRTGDGGPVIGIAVAVVLGTSAFYIGNRIHGDHQLRKIVKQKRLKRKGVLTGLASVTDSLVSSTATTERTTYGTVSASHQINS